MGKKGLEEQCILYAHLFLWMLTKTEKQIIHISFRKEKNMKNDMYKIN